MTDVQAGDLDRMERLYQDRMAGSAAVANDTASQMEALYQSGPAQGKPLDTDAVAASYVGQQQLGAADSPIGLRAFLSMFGDNAEEQDSAFKLTVPDGELFRVPATGQVLYRRSPKEEFRKLDPGFFEQFGKGFGPVVKELAADLADVSGDIPEIAGETLGLLFGRKPGAGKLLGDLTRMAGGSMAGEAFQQGMQSAAGTQKQTGVEIRGLIGGAAVESIVGGTLGAGVGGAVNVARGRGLGGITKEGAEAVRAAERLGTKAPLPSQISELPFVRLLGRQAQALLPRINRYLAEQEQRTASAVRGLVDEKAAEGARREILASFDGASRDIVELARQSVGVRVSGKDARGAGRALQQGFEAWWQTSGKDVDALYSAARAIEEPTFDLTALKGVAAEIDAGVLGRGAGGQTFRLNELDPELQRLVGDINALEAVPGATNAAPVEQLRALRKRVRDLTLSGPEGPREAQAVAMRLKGAIDDALNAPLSDNPEFVNAWRAANVAASRRFSTREQVAVLDLVKSETPAQLALRLAQPGQIDNLATLRNAMPEESFRELQGFFKSELLRDGAGMKAKLDAFDEPTLNVLLSPSDRVIMRDTADQLARLDSPAVQKLAGEQERVGEFVRVLFDNKESTRVTVLGELVQKAGGPQSPLGKTVRSAIVDQIFRQGTITERGVQVLDYGKLSGVLAEYEKRGLLDLLDASERGILKDAQLMQDFARFSSDAGTSLQAASAAADLRVGKWHAISTFIENGTVGRFLTSPTGQKILTGKGLDPKDTRIFKLFGGIAAQIADDAETSQGLGEGFERLARSGFGVRTMLFGSD